MNAIRTFLAGMAVAMASLPVCGQTETVVFDLTTQDGYSQCTASSIQYDRSSYAAWNWSSYSKYPYCYNYNITVPYYADYLTTPALSLQKGTIYAVKTAPAAYSSSYTTDCLSILLGTDDDLGNYSEIASMTNIAYAYKSNAVDKEFTFTVPESGDYYISFYVTKAGLALYNTQIVSLGESNVPDKVQNLTVTPDPEGGSLAQIAFNLPTESVSGKDLPSDLTYIIKRGDDVLTEEAGLPGARVEYLDENAPAGTVEYSVTVYNGEDFSEAATVSTFIGLETPSPVENLKLSSVGSQHSLSWTAPAFGVHGAALDASKLTYQVTQVLDGVETQLDDVTETSTSVTIEPVGLQTLSFKVVAKYGELLSDAAQSNVNTIGALDLPMNESFADATLGTGWSTEIVELSTNWAIVSSASANSPQPDPYDGDGGMAFFNCFYTSRGGSARLMSPPISAESSIAPVVQFYFYHFTKGDDILKLQISCDGGEWTDIPDAQVTLKADEEGWTKYVFAIKDAISEGCASYRLSFTAVSAYGYNLFIDAIRVFNLANRDLELTSLVGPSSIVSGNDAEFTVTVSNNGSEDVAADGYSLNVETSYPVIELPELQPIPSLGSVNYNFTVPVNAAVAYDIDEFKFKASVAYENDENPDNNESEEVTLEVEYAEGTPATELAVEKQNDDLVFTWKAAKDTEYQPVAIAESFEDFEEEATGPFNGFVSLDLDESANSSSIYGTSGSAFNIRKMFSSVPSGIDGTYCLGVTCAANKQQDDWLISPALSCKSTSVYNLSFLIGFYKYYSSWTYNWEIRYATDDYDPENPLEAFSNLVKSESTSTYGNSITNDNALHERSYEVPAEAKYIAIHLTTKISGYTGNATWLDNVRITEVDQNPLLGYNLYDLVAGKVNDELISADAETYTMPLGEDVSTKRSFLVSAVYGAGEAESSNVVVYNDVSALDEVAVAANCVKVENGVINVTAPAGTAIRVVDMLGRVVAAKASSGNDHIALARGIYLVAVGTARYKVALK
jgi:hypothetical protein